MESNRQKKISKILQQDLADILQGAASKRWLKGGYHFSLQSFCYYRPFYSKSAHLSVFPSAKGEEILAGIKANTPLIKARDFSKNKTSAKKDSKFYVFYRRLFRLYRKN